MKQNYYRPGKVNPHLPHDGVELEPAPTDTDVAQRDADLLVSQLMVDSTKPAGPPSTIDGTWIEPVPVQTDTDLTPDDMVAVAQDAVHPADQEPVPAGDEDAALAGDAVAVEFRDETDVTQDLRASFPKLSDETLETQNRGKPGFFDWFPPVYLVPALCVVMAFLAPKLLLWTLIVAVVLLLTAAAMLKLPGLSHLSGWIWRQFVNRSPDRAERVRKWADNAALSFEYVLDRLPGSLADKLSLPDFSQPVTRKR